MKPNVWTRPCEAGACVELMWSKPCETYNCVEVGFQPACEQSSCVEVARHASEWWLVRDSKNPAGEVLTYSTQEWTALVGRIKSGEQVEFSPLVFDADEQEAFVAAVQSGKFDALT